MIHVRAVQDLHPPRRGSFVQEVQRGPFGAVLAAHRAAAAALALGGIDELGHALHLVPQFAGGVEQRVRSFRKQGVVDGGHPEVSLDLDELLLQLDPVPCQFLLEAAHPVAARHHGGTAGHQGPPEDDALLGCARDAGQLVGVVVAERVEEAAQGAFALPRFQDQDALLRARQPPGQRGPAHARSHDREVVPVFHGPPLIRRPAATEARRHGSSACLPQEVTRQIPMSIGPTDLVVNGSTHRP